MWWDEWLLMYQSPVQTHVLSTKEDKEATVYRLALSWRGICTISHCMANEQEPVIPSQGILHKNGRATQDCSLFICFVESIRSAQMRPSKAPVFGSFTFCLRWLGSWLPVPGKRVDIATALQSAEHCCGTAGWFRVRLPVMSHASIFSQCDTVYHSFSSNNAIIMWKSMGKYTNLKSRSSCLLM